MATQSVPYNAAMQLGSGFNSFTQTLCIDHAVGRDGASEPVVKENKSEAVAQSVTYKMSIVKKTSDVTNQMNIGGAFSIKYDQLSVDGAGSYIDTNKIKESDVSILVSVKVVNQTIYDHSLVKFQPITNIKDANNMKDATPQRLVEVYGDSFISGWQEGGEFLGVISIKAKNRDEAQTITADATIAFSRSKETPAEGGGKLEKADLYLELEKVKNNIVRDNEVSVSVTWTGGGQAIKAPEKDWTFEVMRDVALRFPDLCAKTPIRTHALLTKYTALRSFYTAQSFELPLYDKTGTYVNVLHEAYLDYKSILGSIQVLAFDASEGTKVLVANPRANKAIEQAKISVQGKGEDEDTDGDDKSNTGVSSIAKIPNEKEKTNETSAPGGEGAGGGKNKLILQSPKSFEEAFPPTIEGLEEARLQCRFQMNRIVQEIDNIAIKPEIATDENRQVPYLSPFLFKMLLPLGVTIIAEATPVAQAVAASKIDPEALAAKMGVGALS